MECLIRQIVGIDEMPFGFMLGRGNYQHDYYIVIHFTPDTREVPGYQPAAAIHAFGDLERVFNRVLRDFIWWNLACWETTSELVQCMFKYMRSRVSC